MNETGITVSAVILIVFVLCYLMLKLSADAEIPIWHLFLALTECVANVCVLFYINMMEDSLSL